MRRDGSFAALRMTDRGLCLVGRETADHLAAWVEVAPGNNESAGRRVGKTLEDNTRLKTALVKAAHGAGRSGPSRRWPTACW